MPDEKPNKQDLEMLSACGLCHRRGTGCCALGGGDIGQMFGLTKGEIEAITQASGLAPERFLVADRIDEDFVRLISEINQVFLDTMPGGNRIRLKVKKSGECFFLDPDGCRLPQSARPLYCRLYPFCITSDERLMVLLSSTCLAQEGASTWRDVLRTLEEEEDNVRHTFERLKTLAREHRLWVESGGKLTDLEV